MYAESVFEHHDFIKLSFIPQISLRAVGIVESGTLWEGDLVQGWSSTAAGSGRDAFDRVDNVSEVDVFDDI